MSLKQLGKISTRDILAEVARRRRLEVKLKQRRAKLLKELRSLDQVLGASRPAAKPVRKKRVKHRARNKMTLNQAMAKVMSKSKALSVSQIAKAAKKAGYKSVSKTFPTIIYQTLARDKQFKRESRGQYILRAA